MVGEGTTQILGGGTDRYRKGGSSKYHIIKKCQNAFRLVVCMCFLSTTGIQCLVADGPLVLGLSVWSDSGSKQHCGV